MYTHTPRGVRPHGRTGAATMAALSVLTTGAVVIATPSTVYAAPTVDLVPVAAVAKSAPAFAGPTYRVKRSVRTTQSTLATETAAIKQGAQVVLSGTLTYGASARPVANHPVQLQASTGSDWKTVANQLVNTDGSVTFTVEPATTTKYRLAYAGVGSMKATISEEQGITVKVPPPPPPPVVRTTTSTASSYSAPAVSIGSAGVGSGSGAAVVAAAAAYSGAPYVYAASGPYAFDCSGLTSYVYKQFGVYLPHNAHAQMSYGTPVSAAQAAPGDLIFFLDGGYAYHVGIYAGGNTMIDAPNSGSTVGYHQIWSSNIAFRRIF